MTKYFTDVSEVNKIIKNYAVFYNKSNKAKSLWYFELETENPAVVICTTAPGIWIGKAGVNHEDLKASINGAIDTRNSILENAYKNNRIAFEPEMIPHLDVKYIECNF